MRLEERYKDGTFSMFEIIISTGGGLPVVFSPRMWERIYGSQQESGWHISDAGYANGVLKYQNRQNTISVATAPDDRLLEGLLTEGGAAFHLTGQRVYGSKYDFYSHRTPDGQKVRQRDNPEEFQRQLGPIWYDIILSAIRDLKAFKPDEEWDYETRSILNNIIESIETNKDEYIRELDFAPTIRYAQENSVAAKGFHYLAHDLPELLSELFRNTSDISPAQIYDFTPEQTKEFGRIKQRVVREYLDAQEKVVRNTVEEFRDIGDPERGWNEVLLTKYSADFCLIYSTPSGQDLLTPTGKYTKTLKQLIAILDTYDIPYEIVAESSQEEVLKMLRDKSDVFQESSSARYGE
ncbi:MAG: hypothetical protein LC687_03565, partial [Actinobacteria bacterium]|nr:hypothetical protein [Actinomycetota bacterium]